MKTSENKRALLMCWGVELIAVGALLFAGCETGGGGMTISAADCVRAEKLRVAEIRAEANLPGPSDADEQRIATTMTSRNEQEQHELAEYAKFQFEQKLELAEASGPRIYTSSQEEADGVSLGQINPERHRNTFALDGHASRYGRGQSGSDRAGVPDRFYVRNIQENSADQLVSDSADRERQGNANGAGGAPFGAPVPGKPGYVTSPTPATSGYIDVRGYQPGSTVIDPYTGRVMRIP